MNGNKAQAADHSEWDLNIEAFLPLLAISPCQREIETAEKH